MVWLVGVLFLAAVASAYLFPRPMVAVLVVVVLFVGGVLSYAVYDLENSRTIRDHLSAKVVIGAEKCADPARPIGIEFTNDTGNTVAYTVYSLAAYRPGHSRKVLDLHSLNSDRIIATASSWLTCIAVPTKLVSGSGLAGLKWEIAITSVIFQ